MNPMRALNFVFNRSEWSGGARFVCCRVIARGCVALLPGCGVALLPAHPVDLRVQGEDVVEYPGKVACPSGRRCSTRNAVWCHSHPGFKSQRYRHCRPAPLGPGGFVMPTRRAWVACDAAGGPGCFVCPWAAARPRAVRAASFARRVASKPGQAPPPPTGTAARPLTALRRPPHQWGWVADVCLRVVSKPGQASRLEARSILSFACNSLMPAVCGSVKSPEFQRLNFKA